MTRSTESVPNFREEAREAMTFYQSVLGGELSRSTVCRLHASEIRPSRKRDARAPGHRRLGSTDGRRHPNRWNSTGSRERPFLPSGDDEETLRRWFEAQRKRNGRDVVQAPGARPRHGGRPPGTSCWSTPVPE